MNNKAKKQVLEKYFETSVPIIKKHETRKVFSEEELNNKFQVIPTKLYKYRQCSACNIKALRNNIAWFSEPTEWADKFDSTICIDLEKQCKDMQDNFSSYSLKIVVALINYVLEQKGHNNIKISENDLDIGMDGCFTLEEGINQEKLEGIILNKYKKNEAVGIISKINKVFEVINNNNKVREGLDKLLSFFLDFNKTIRDTFLLYSVSESFDDHHQWDFYGDKNKGFCIEYNFKQKIYSAKQQKLIMDLLPIYYGEKESISVFNLLLECVIMNLSTEQEVNVKNLNELCRMFVSIYTKDKDYSQEHEWRFYASKKENIRNSIHFDFVSGIYLGVDISDENEKELLEIAKSNKWKIYKQKIDSYSSKYIYQNISGK